MPAQPPKTNLKIRDQMLETWRQARFGEIVLTCKTASEAMNLRFALYNVAKPFRAPGAMTDEELREALETVSVSYSKDDPLRVVLRPKASGWMGDVIGSALAGAGVDPEAVQSPEDRAAAESFAKVNELLERSVKAEAAEPAPAPHAADAFREPSPAQREYGKAPNPFYTRNGTGSSS